MARERALHNVAVSHLRRKGLTHVESRKRCQTRNARELAPAPAIAPALPVEERRLVAWVGKSVVFKGTMTSLEDITIDGQVEGAIEVRDQSLTVGPDAHIRAEIVAKTVTIHGTVIR